MDSPITIHAKKSQQDYWTTFQEGGGVNTYHRQEDKDGTVSGKHQMHLLSEVKRDAFHHISISIITF
jgi:hypothetical protein